MRRTDRLVIMLNAKERISIERLAKAERLPTSTAARRILLDVAEARKINGDDRAREQ